MHGVARMEAGIKLDRREFVPLGKRDRKRYRNVWLWMFLLKFGLVVTAIIVIILVLLQKGKGGGLAGLGGAGGQSAFGTKAGDLFTRITIAVAGIWILICVIAVPMAATQLTNRICRKSAIKEPIRRQGQPPPPPSGEKPASDRRCAKPEPEKEVAAS